MLFQSRYFHVAEGIADTTYLYTLAKAIEKNRTAGKNKPTVEKAQAFLASLDQQIPEYPGVHGLAAGQGALVGKGVRADAAELTPQWRREIAAPVGALFGEICQQQALGVSIEHAIRDAAERSTSEDMRLLATSVAIQSRSGGNLVDMIERLAFVIRDRKRLNRRVRVLTAQTQLGKRILAGLPFVLFALLTVLNPDYMTPLYSTAMGRMLLAGAAVSVLIGIYVMNRMAVLRF